MASLLIKAEKLSVGDILLLPFGKTATVTQIKPFGERALNVSFKTENGWSKVSRNTEVFVEARAL